jgi:hypothetical protein
MKQARLLGFSAIFALVVSHLCAAETGVNNNGGWSGTYRTTESQPFDSHLAITSMNAVVPSDLPTTYAGDFYGPIFDGEFFWYLPCYADRFLRIGRQGDITSFKFSNYSISKAWNNRYKGGAFDGVSIWIAPHSQTGAMVKFDTHAFVMSVVSIVNTCHAYTSGAYLGMAFDGDNMWLVPHHRPYTSIINVNNGTQWCADNWPAGITPSSYMFQGAVFDGRFMWFIPDNAVALVKVDKYNTGDMRIVNTWPGTFIKTTTTAFSGGIIDGRNIWLVPRYAAPLIKIDVDTDVMTDFGRLAMPGNPNGYYYTHMFKIGDFFYLPCSWHTISAKLVQFDPNSGSFWDVKIAGDPALWNGGYVGFDGSRITLYRQYPAGLAHPLVTIGNASLTMSDSSTPSAPQTETLSRTTSVTPPPTVTPSPTRTTTPPATRTRSTVTAGLTLSGTEQRTSSNSVTASRSPSQTTTRSASDGSVTRSRSVSDLEGTTSGRATASALRSASASKTRSRLRDASLEVTVVTVGRRGVITVRAVNQTMPRVDGEWQLRCIVYPGTTSSGLGHPVATTDQQCANNTANNSVVCGGRGAAGVWAFHVDVLAPSYSTAATLVVVHVTARDAKPGGGSSWFRAGIAVTQPPSDASDTSVAHSTTALRSIFTLHGGCPGMKLPIILMTIACFALLFVARLIATRAATCRWLHRHSSRALSFTTSGSVPSRRAITTVGQSTPFCCCCRPPSSWRPRRRCLCRGTASHRVPTPPSRSPSDCSRL